MCGQRVFDASQYFSQPEAVCRSVDTGIRARAHGEGRIERVPADVCAGLAHGQGRLGIACRSAHGTLLRPVAVPMLMLVQIATTLATVDPVRRKYWEYMEGKVIM